MTNVSLLRYGPFVIGEYILYTEWEIKEINWNTVTNKVHIKLVKGKEVIIEESEYSIAAHQTEEVGYSKIIKA